MIDPIFFMLALILGLMLNGWSKEALVKRKVRKYKIFRASAMSIWIVMIVTGLFIINA